MTILVFLNVFFICCDSFLNHSLVLSCIKIWLKTFLIIGQDQKEIHGLFFKLVDFLEKILQNLFLSINITLIKIFALKKAWINWKWSSMFSKNLSRNLQLKLLLSLRNKIEWFHWQLKSIFRLLDSYKHISKSKLLKGTRYHCWWPNFII